MHFLQAINSNISVLTVCNKTGGTIKGDINKYTFNKQLLCRSLIKISTSIETWKMNNLKNKLQLCSPDWSSRFIERQ